MRPFIVLFVSLSITLLCLSSKTAYALETQPGDACTIANQTRSVGGPENPGAGYILVCNGSTWVSIKEWNPSTSGSLFQVGNDTGSCVPAKDGRIRFNSSQSPPWQYCDGSAWSPFKQPRCLNDGAGGCFAASMRLDSDPDFIPENIAAGTNILGVVGTLIDGMQTIAIETGLVTGCVLDNAGVAKCWGMGSQGQIGDGTFTTPAGPVFVSAGSVSGTAWTNITAGQTNSCGIRDDGTAWCWGLGSYGAIGNSSNANQGSPALVNAAGTTGTAWTDIDAGGFHVCGIRNDGTGWCWGNDAQGGLGNGATGGNLNVPSPITLTGVTGTAWTKIRNGYSNSCGLRDDGTAWCWGYNYYGALGNSNTTQQLAPVAVSTGGVTGTSWTDITVSIGYHACGVRDNGSMWCWGYGEDGELGNGTNTVTQTTPVLVNTAGVSGTAWVSAAAQQWSSCGIRDDGTAWCWGYNTYGQLGNGTITPSNVPVQVDASTVTGTSWTQLVGGGLFACGIRNDATAWCWGDPTYGALTNVDFGTIKPVAD